MKFDFCIGNPPYQEETIGDNDSFAPPVYDKFLDAARTVADKVEMIHPARFLFNAGGTSKEWNKKMLQDEHFKILYYEVLSRKVFKNTDIKGGIAVSYADSTCSFGKMGVFTPFPELNLIGQKVVKREDFIGFDSIVSGRTPYLFTEEMHKDFPNVINKLSKGHKYDISSNAFEVLPEIFLEHKIDGDEYYKIVGRFKNKRVFRYVKKRYVCGRKEEYCTKYKVILPKANGSGSLGEVLSTPLIGTPLIGTPLIVSTDTFLVIGSFDNEADAKHLLKYVKCKFTRALLGILKVTQPNSKDTWKYVPLQDFSNKSDIDWTKSVHEIDLQLYKKYGLSDEEVRFIEEKVKTME